MASDIKYMVGNTKPRLPNDVFPSSGRALLLQPVWRNRYY